ncbi:MAG: IS1634 family transposase, partial [Candidatus Sericytochromatia bacterium]|nr:IS1634 family transposase [Candidatus Tanganyikabacteria bacterium]
MVLNRLVDPKSKRGCNDWLRDLAYFPEWTEKWDVQDFYRALDILHDHWDEVEAILYRALWERTPPELRKVWLVDTTSMYFEMTRSDKELAELFDEHVEAELTGKEPPLAPVPQVVNREPFFRMRGHNKDGHPGDPQVVIASIVTPGGQIVRHRTYPGNTNDLTIAQDLIATVPAPAGTVRVWVSDAGTVDDERLLSLDLDGWDRVTAEALRKDPWVEEHLLKRPGRFKQSTEDSKFSYREVTFSAEDLAMGRPEKFILVRNAFERERQLKRLAKQKSEVQEALAGQRDEKPHGKRLCDVASNPSLKKFLKPSDKAPGQFVFDEATYKREVRLAGTRLLRTTLTAWDAQDVHTAYGLLQEVERNHRELKTPLMLRPCYQRADHRIKAHVMINVRAINCLRQMEHL